MAPTGLIEPRQGVPGIGRIVIQHTGTAPSKGYLASVAARLACQVNVDKGRVRSQRQVAPCHCEGGSVRPLSPRYSGFRITALDWQCWSPQPAQTLVMGEPYMFGLSTRRLGYNPVSECPCKGVLTQMPLFDVRRRIASKSLRPGASLV